MTASINHLPGPITTVIIGAGHAGLAMSRCLTDRAIDHVLLERGEIANSWQTERWDSLRLLTPNWQNVLPGFRYAGDDPEGYMSMPEIAAFIKSYASVSAAPVATGTTVTSVRHSAAGYQVQTTRGTWQCRSLVLASGACNKPAIPVMADVLPSSVQSLSPLDYRNPAQLEPGGVLIVGASATGLQIAQEIQRSGRQVTLATGEHVRMPRLYRGRDIQWWLDRAGILDHRIEQEPDSQRARGLPSPQLIGSNERATLDLNALMEGGVDIVGRLAGIRDGKAQFSGSLRNVCTLADLKLGRLLKTIDAWSTSSGTDGLVTQAERFAPTRVPKQPRMNLELAGGSIRTVIWATGFRPDYSWLHVPVLDRKGRLIHDRGVVGGSARQTPGLYALGLSYMRRRKSGFIYGAANDASDLSAHLADFVDQQIRADRSKISMPRGCNLSFGLAPCASTAR